MTDNNNQKNYFERDDESINSYFEDRSKYKFFVQEDNGVDLKLDPDDQED